MKQQDEKGLVPSNKRELVLEGDPEQQLAFATKAANALMKVVKPANIKGKQYLLFGGWQTLGRFFGATVGIEWTKPIVDKGGAVVGFEARAEVLQHGVRISSAEASCLRSERNWASREEFALKSMAQTRASAKALRNAFGWVAELAGLESTPAEEMSYDDAEFDKSPVEDGSIPIMVGADPGPSADRIEAPQKAQKVRASPSMEKKKARIKNLIDSMVLAPLDQTAEAYALYVLENTGLDLEPWNYDKIIAKLEAQ